MEPSVYFARASLKSTTVVFLDRNVLSGTPGAFLTITWNSEQFCATVSSVCLGWSRHLPDLCLPNLVLFLYGYLDSKFSFLYRTYLIKLEYLNHDPIVEQTLTSGWWG